MISTHKYAAYRLPKPFFGVALLLFSCITANAQLTIGNKENSANKNKLSFYHSIAPEKVKRTFQHIDYTLPDNQLMNWQNYPLTIEEIERRDKLQEQDNKLSNIIVKDIITSLLSKKKKTAVIPKF